MSNTRSVKSEPKYVSIYKELRANILSDDSGILKLPPENQLMTQYNVSRTTIRKATQLLKDEQLIESRQGRGTDIIFNSTIPKNPRQRRITQISSASFSFTAASVQSRTHSEMLVDIVPAVKEIAQALEIIPGENVYRIRWLHHVNDQPFMYMSNYVRMDLAPTLPQVVAGKSSLYRIFAEEYGYVFESAEESIEPVTADFISASLLGVPVGTPLLLVCRRARFDKGPVEYSRRLIRTDMQKLTLYLK